VIKYADDEGDLVFISSQLELEEAIKLQTLNGSILRLTVSANSQSKPISLQKPPSESGLYPPIPFVQARNLSNEQFFADAPQGENKPRADQLQQIQKQIDDLKAKKRAFKQGKKSSEGTRDINVEGKKELKSQLKTLKYERKELRRGKPNSNLRARFISLSNSKYSFTPGETFTYIVKFRNEGSDTWPAGTALVPIGKNADHQLLGSAETNIPVPQVAPGETVDIPITLQAPMKGGRYLGYWRLATSDWIKFGQRVDITVYVETGDSSDEEKKIKWKKVDWMAMLDELNQRGYSDKKKNIRLLKQFKGDVGQVIDHYQQQSH
jgi:hypothetical protein